MKHSEFKKAAENHQVEYKKKYFGTTCDKYYKHKKNGKLEEDKSKPIKYYLTDEDAKKGKNFFSGFGIFEAAKKYCPIYFSFPLSRRRINLYSNMLRSEHIPFNLFVPFRQDLEFAKKVFNEILGSEIISKVDEIIIEYPPSPKENYLNDGTSFDTYIEYTDIKNSKGIICIEVKYTEKEYKLEKGSKQEKDINDKTGKYYYVSEKCEIYKPIVIDKLKTDLFRQIWRNHILAESIVIENEKNNSIEDKVKIKQAHSLIFYPKGNEHFTEVGNEYKEMLAEDKKNKFGLVTFEKFIEICRNCGVNDEFEEWVNYLEKRYIVK